MKKGNIYEKVSVTPSCLSPQQGCDTIVCRFQTVWVGGRGVEGKKILSGGSSYRDKEASRFGARPLVP